MYRIKKGKEKLQLTKNVWNNQILMCISLVFTVNSEWRNRNQFINGQKLLGNENREFQ
ncbi:DUF1348 family protein [Apibacter adventoris]|uniref:DUF1348 family protein n=1 Tax=Apibacter adventoris TaxID=1679466 RepID=UPI000CF669FF|nr:DUF1348 family protein [Apibacter adventoris]PQL94991.1 hypothetical protein C4S76_03670 [Apibacter adventoris]